MTSFYRPQTSFQAITHTASEAQGGGKAAGGVNVEPTVAESDPVSFAQSLHLSAWQDQCQAQQLDL